MGDCNTITLQRNIFVVEQNKSKLWMFCIVFAMSLCASVCVGFVVTCWERADLLALVCGVCCEFVTFPLVSWVGCGT